LVPKEFLPNNTLHPQNHQFVLLLIDRQTVKFLHLLHLLL
jgi:hypothetical protein